MDQRLPDEHDVSGPSKAELYDATLGEEPGAPRHTEHYADATNTVRNFPWPRIQSNGPANRKFLRRAVDYLARAGIDQFLELGSAKRTPRGNVHQVAQAVRPGSRVVYVDNDPTVQASMDVAWDDDPSWAYLERDIRKPEGILTDPATTRLIDLRRPVGLLLVTTLHYLGNDDDPYGVVGQYLEHLAAGSYLVISHVATDGAPKELVELLGQPQFGGLTLRPSGEILRLFHGLPLEPPGRLVDVRQWPTDTGEERSEVPLLCGVAPV